MKNHLFMYKLTLILMALISYIGVTLITPVMSGLAADFPSAGQLTLNLIVMLPTATIPLGLFAAAFLSERMSRKLLVTAVLTMLIIVGVMPFFVRVIPVILLCRAFLGLGIGLLLPIQVTYFAEFDSDTRAKLFGYNSVVNSLLAAALFAVIGAVNMAWYYVFLLYSIMIIVLIFVIIFVPTQDNAADIAETNHSDDKQQGSILQPEFIYSCVAVILIMGTYMIMPTTVSFYMMEHHLGGVKEASLLSSATTIAIAICGILYPIIRSKFKGHTATLCFILLTISFVLYGNPVNAVFFWTGFILVAAAVTIISTNFTMQLTETLPTSQIAFASALLNCSIFGGQFLSAYLQNGIMAALHVSVETSYLIFAAIMAALMIIHIVMLKHRP